MVKLPESGPAAGIDAKLPFAERGPAGFVRVPRLAMVAGTAGAAWASAPLAKELSS